MFRGKDAEEESPEVDVAGSAAWSYSIVAEHVYDCGGGDAAEPGEETEGIEPWSNAVRSLWDRAFAC